MDEILTTIRRIIAEDEGSRSATAGPQTASAGAAGVVSEPPPLADHAAAAEPEVLELTRAVNDDGSVRDLTPRTAAAVPPPGPSSEPSTGPVAGGIGSPDMVEPEAAASPSTASAVERASDAELVSDTASLAAAAAFARLAAAPRGAPEPPLVGDRRLDDIVRELLRPMLRTWLDENLPSIVERLVEAEVARLAARSRGG